MSSDPAGAALAPDDSSGRGVRDGVEVELHVLGDDTYPDWEAIYSDNISRVYRLMFSRVGIRCDAEDLTAEVFLAALRPLRVSASVGEVRAYLVATAQSVLATYWRKRLGTQVTVVGLEAALDFLAERSPGLPEVATPETSSPRLGVVLDALPERYRRVLDLRFLQGCSVQETAAEVGVSVGNAKVLQHRALRRAAAIAEQVAP